MGKEIKPQGHSPRPGPYVPPRSSSTGAIPIAGRDSLSSIGFVREEQRQTFSLSAPQLSSPQGASPTSASISGCPSFDNIFCLDEELAEAAKKKQERTHECRDKT